MISYWFSSIYGIRSLVYLWTNSFHFIFAKIAGSDRVSTKLNCFSIRQPRANYPRVELVRYHGTLLCQKVQTLAEIKPTQEARLSSKLPSYSMLIFNLVLSSRWFLKENIFIFSLIVQISRNFYAWIIFCSRHFLKQTVHYTNT